jgi:hypothetical protein
MTRQIFAVLATRVVPPIVTCASVTKKGSRSPPPQRAAAYPLYYRGGFTSARINLQVPNHYRIVMFGKSFLRDRLLPRGTNQ